MRGGEGGLFRCLTIMRNSGGGVSRRSGADDGGGGRQEEDGEADGAVRADGSEIHEDDRRAVKTVSKLKTPQG